MALFGVYEEFRMEEAGIEVVEASRTYGFP